MLSPDTILQGRYRIMRQLGQGGMGAVYEAVDERLDTLVALKETLFTDEKLRKQFEREARLLARLHHQALPRVSDHFNEGDGQFLVMQYIAGEDFAEMLKDRDTPFTQPEVLQWADQLCDALDYLHTQEPQIIHRDIKPQNLKLTARGQVVLLDFGLAKGSAGQMSVVTTSASIYGYTPNYAPLEQVQGLGTDARSDIYSLAATLYHLATNVKPSDALSRAAAIVNGLPDPLLPAHTVVPQVSMALADVLSKGMSQKRDDRYVSDVAMRDALRTAAAAQQTFPEAETGVARVVKASGKANTIASEQGTRLISPRTASVGSEAQTLLATDVINVRPSVSPVETVTVVHRAPGEKVPWTWLTAAAVVVLVAGMAGGFYAYRGRQQAVTQDPAPASQTFVPATDSNTGAVPAAESPDVKSAESNTTTVPAAESSSSLPDAKSAEPKNENARATTLNQRAAPTKPSTEKEPEVTKTATPQPANQQTTTPDVGRNGQRSQNQNSAVDNSASVPSQNQLDQWRRRRREGDDARVKTLPNGTRIETLPDGTHLVTFPDGRTRAFPPGVKPNRRRNPGP